MKLLTEEQLVERLAEAYKRGLEDMHRFGFYPGVEQVEYRLRDLIHADAGGFDSKGQEVGNA